jgi:hypothetical protein
MAKKRKTEKRQGQTEVILESEEEWVAYLLTRLFHRMNPAVHQPTAFEVTLLMLEEGLSEENVERYGTLLKATMTVPPTSSVH